MFVGLDNAKDIHDTDWEFDISSSFIIDLNTGFFILSDDVDFSSSEGEFEVISA